MPISRRKLAASLSKMPRIAAAVQAIVQAKQFHGVIDAAEAAALAKALGAPVDELALGLVETAKLYAVTPVSRYSVGAVAVGWSGALYFGANLEIAGQALGVTVHAEQSAVANAWVNGERGLATLAISAAPCGHCRQFLNELDGAATLTVMLPTGSQLLAGFLPDAFGPGDLGKSGGLMRTRKRRLAVARRLDPVGAAALEAASVSYSPYTRTFAGVALRTRNGVVCTGRYAENAAYNPSLSPLQAALSQLVLHGQPFSSITRAVLVQAPGRASQVDATRSVLRAVCRAPLTVYEVT